MVLVSIAALIVTVPAWSASSERGLEPLQRAFAAGRLEMRRFQERPKPPQSALAAGLVELNRWSQLPAPDAPTLAWLSARIPGLDAGAVRVVPLDIAEAAMQRALVAKVTYLDILTDQAFRGQEIYYTPEPVLNELHRKYISGTMPIQGDDEDGKPFQMQALLAGQSKVDMLYDREKFTLKENGTRFKVEKKGRIAATILGAGDIGLEGLSAYGAPVFCPWAKIQRMRKESMYKMHVETSCGSRGGNDVHPIRLR